MNRDAFTLRHIATQQILPHVPHNRLLSWEPARNAADKDAPIRVFATHVAADLARQAWALGPARKEHENRLESDLEIVSLSIAVKGSIADLTRAAKLLDDFTKDRGTDLKITEQLLDFLTERQNG